MSEITLKNIHELNTDTIGFFRFKKFDQDTYLITNDVWKFHFFSLKDFEIFVSWDVKNLDTYDELVAKGFIKTEDYVEKMAGSYAMKNHFLWLGPTLHMIVTTLRCNHKCRYCHAAVAPMKAVEFDMTKETAEKVVDAIFYTNSPYLTIEFQWWESLVNYDVVQHIVWYARTKAEHLNKELTFSLVSNLTLLSEEKLQWLFDNNVDICTSLDGNKLIHNNNRTWFDGDSYEKVTYRMKRISEERQKRWLGKMWALLTVTREGIENYQDIIDTYVKLGLDGIFLRWLNPYGFAAAQKQELAYSNDEWIEFYIKSMDYIIDINKRWTPFRENITSVYLQKIFGVRDPGFMDIRSPSWLSIGGVAYNYDGKIYASDESRMLGRMGIDDFLMTDMKEDWSSTYKAMINSDITKISVQSSCLDWLPWYDDHVYKPYIWVDIIHNFKINGNLYTPIAKDEKMKFQIAILDYIFEKLRDEETREIFMSWISHS